MSLCLVGEQGNSLELFTTESKMDHKTKQKNHLNEKQITSYNIDNTNEYIKRAGSTLNTSTLQKFIVIFCYFLVKCVVSINSLNKALLLLFIPIKDVGIAWGQGVFQATSIKFPQPRTRKFRGVKVKKVALCEELTLCICVKLKEAFFIFFFTVATKYENVGKTVRKF